MEEAVESEGSHPDLITIDDFLHTVIIDWVILIHGKT